MLSSTASMTFIFAMASGSRVGTGDELRIALRKQIALDRILAANFQFDLFDVCPCLMPDFTGTVDGGVERDFNLDPPRRAMNVDPLIGVELCRAGERGGPSAKIQRGRCQAVSAQLLVELYNAGNPLWFRSKDKAREGNRVTANIHQSAASDVALIADDGGT